VSNPVTDAVALWLWCVGVALLPAAVGFACVARVLEAANGRR